MAHWRWDRIFSQIRLPSSLSQNVIDIIIDPGIFRRFGRIPVVKIDIGKPELQVAYFRLIPI